MASAWTVRVGRPGLVVSRGGRVARVYSPAQLRLLLALEAAGGALPIRAAARAIFPGHRGALTPSQRASAARSVTRLHARGVLTQDAAGQALAPVARRFLDGYRAAIAQVLAAAA